MATRIQKETAQRMLQKLNGELDTLFQKQEMGKGGQLAQMCGGGRLKRPFGGSLINAISQGLSGSPIGFSPQGIGIGQALSGLTSGIGQSLGPQTQQLPGINYQSTGTGNNLTLGAKFNNFMGNNPWVGQVGRGIGNAAYAGASYAPGLYNLAQGLQPAEQINYGDFRNPEYNKSTSLMANRRHDPGAELGAVEEADAVYRQGLRQLPGSSGSVHNRLRGAATQRLQGRSDVLRGTQNINRGYEGEEAQFRAGIGAQDVNTRFNVENINAGNRAARRNFLGEAMTNLQQVTMQNRLMKNQRQRDDRLFELAQSTMSNYEFGDDYRLNFRK